MLRFDPDELPDAAAAGMYDRLAELGGALTDDDLPTFDPPAEVWDGIVSRLGAEPGLRVVTGMDRPVVVPDDAAPVTALADRRRAWVLPASIAAAVVVLGGVIGGLALAGDDAQPIELAAAPLEALRPVVDVPRADTARAVAKLVEEGDGSLHLELAQAAMPQVPDGFHYEIWMVDPEVADPRSLSAGDMDGRVDFPVPAGVDPAEYPIVDVSVEPNDGDPGHAGLDHSILRGRLQL